MVSFACTLNYTACNEDWESERAALRLGPGDDVLCVTASGDRPLHHQLDGPRSVTSVDMNALQNHLLWLKLAAAQVLDYPSYRRFLGLDADRERASLLGPVLEACPPEVQGYWRARHGLVERGILYEGRWERYYAGLAQVARTMRSSELRALFSFEDLREQREFLRTRWDKAWWRATFISLCSSGVSQLFFGDPGLYTHLSERIPTVGGYLYDRLLHILRRVLARENFMVALLLQGHFGEHSLPAYLGAEGHARLRERPHRIQTVTADIITYLESVPPGSFSAFSLSDLVSHLPQPAFERLLRAMVRAARPGARFCIRQFLSEHEVPEELAPLLRREPELEEALEQRDRSFVYRFMVGTIHGA